jgi:hypothetical protein
MKTRKSKLTKLLKRLNGKVATLTKLISLGKTKYLVDLIDLEQKITLLSKDILGIRSKVIRAFNLTHYGQRFPWDESQSPVQNLDRLFKHLSEYDFHKWSMRQGCYWEYAHYLLSEWFSRRGLTVDSFILNS